MQSSSGQNPILAAVDSCGGGADINDLLNERQHLLPTPESWLDAGWDALATLDTDGEIAEYVVQVMCEAWKATGDLGRGARQAWLVATPRRAQVLWQKAIHSAETP